MQTRWIFSFLNSLENKDITTFEQKLSLFLLQWKAHGQEVTARFEILHLRFLMIEALSDNTSGCSIDSMTKNVHQIAQESGFEIADSAKIFYKNNGNIIDFVDFREIETAFSKDILTKDSLIYDTTANNGFPIEKQLSDSWLKKYL